MLPVNLYSWSVNPDLWNESTYGVQKICFMDSIWEKLSQRFPNPMNTHKSLLHKGFANTYSVQGICFVDLFGSTVIKRFVSRICFVLWCSKDLFCGFISELLFSKLLNLFWFRKFHVRFLHPYCFIFKFLFSSLILNPFWHSHTQTHKHILIS